MATDNRIFSQRFFEQNWLRLPWVIKIPKREGIVQCEGWIERRGTGTCKKPALWRYRYLKTSPVYPGMHKSYCTVHFQVRAMWSSMEEHERIDRWFARHGLLPDVWQPGSRWAYAHEPDAVRRTVYVREDGAVRSDPATAGAHPDPAIDPTKYLVHNLVLVPWSERDQYATEIRDLRIARRKNREKA